MKVSLFRKLGGYSGFGLEELAKLRLLAIRQRVFFRVLSRVERGLIWLVLRVTKSVRSTVLANALSSIVEKLLEAMESKVELWARQIGVPLAQKISRIAQSWGNRTASEWANDCGFIRYLSITTMQNER
jgi:hypothetical protein